MRLDPHDEFIRTITAHCCVDGKMILEVGCGQGRITHDLTQHARRVFAVDPDEKSLRVVQSRLGGDHVDLVCCRGELLAFPNTFFDRVVYSLSLHHIPRVGMLESLKQAGALLDKEGEIVVIEPGKTGTLIEAEKHFGVGDGDEEREKDAARKAIAALQGWRIRTTVHFQTWFYFDDLEDFLNNLPFNHRRCSAALLDELAVYLGQHAEEGMIKLHAERRMDVLART